MKNQANTNFVSRSTLALALAMAIWSPVQSRSAEPAEGMKMMEGKMMERCMAMKEHKDKMMAEMNSQDAELNSLVARMNSAPQDKKLDLMAAVVTHMAQQRITMNAHMGKMHEEMMKHMMQHMQMGKESMMQCPMMKGMREMDEKADTGHKGHHEEPK